MIPTSLRENNRQPGPLRCTLGFALALLFAILALALPHVAHAAGSIVPEKTTLDEADGKWKLKLKIDLGSVPDLAYVPMTFTFTPTVYYERACTDESGGKPILNKKPLQNQSPISIPTEVGFSDGTGKTFKATKYDFTIRRDDRFEAGEYSLEITRDGKPLGGKFTVTLNGDNIVVDRRAMTFAGDNRPAKDDPCRPPREKPSGDSGSKPSDGSTSSPDKPKGGSDDSQTSNGTENPSGDKVGDGKEQPGTLPPKQGGCGCKVGDTEIPEGAGVVFAIGALIFVGRRRRLVMRGRLAA